MSSGYSGCDVVILEFSAFAPSRSLYIAEALLKAGLTALILTTRPVYVEEGVKPRREVRYLGFQCRRSLYASILGRVYCYTRFALQAALTLVRFKPSVVYARNVFAALAAVLYKSLVPGVKVVLEVSDLWPEALAYLRVSEALKSFLMRVGQLINAHLYGRVDAIVAHNEVLARFLERRTGRKVHVLLGAIDLEKFRPMSLEWAERRFGVHRRGFTVLYAGLLGPFQDPWVILDVAAKLGGEAGVTFLIVGTGPLRRGMEERAAREGLSVKFLDPVPHDMMPLVYNLADVCLMTYAPTGFLSMGLPKKFVEYAACGKPIICVAPPCVASLLCEEWSAGLVVEPGDVEGLAAAILKLRGDGELRAEMGFNARRMAETLFSPRRVVEVFREALG